MLLSKHCPYTGIVNFYDERDPHLSIGSIAKCGTAATRQSDATCYTWRFYAADGTKAGRSLDAPGAERSLRAMLTAAYRSAA